MKSALLTGIVLKRVSVGEADRVVTFLTRERGKVTVVAKGARKLTSSKLACLEPGSESRIYTITTKSMPIVTQAQLVQSFVPVNPTLVHVRNTFQILELLDALLVEEDPQEGVYELALEMLESVKRTAVETHAIVAECFQNLIELMGFDANTVKFKNGVSCYVEELTQKKMKSFRFFS